METLPYDPFDPAVNADPYPAYAWLRDNAPAYRYTPPGQRPFWLISRYDDVLAILRHPSLVNNLASVSPTDGDVATLIGSADDLLMVTMIASDPPAHTRLRGLVQKLFAPQQVAQMEPTIRAIAERLIDGFAGRGRFDLVQEFAYPLPMTVICELLGIPPEDRLQFRQWADVQVTGTLDSAQNDALAEAWRAQVAYLKRLFVRRRADPQPDLITALLEAEEQGDRLTEMEVCGMVSLLVVAGHETTMNLIAKGTLALLQHPDQLALLRQQPDLIGPAVEELLRYRSPIANTALRVATEDLVVAGQTIRRGEWVLALVGAANHDERAFDAPTRLDIARPPRRHVAFGYGLHFCLGAALARLEGAVAISALLGRLPQLRLAGPASAIEWRPGMFVHSPRRLPLEG